jgi:hypothetical protein
MSKPALKNEVKLNEDVDKNNLTRSFSIRADKPTIDVENRTIEVSFSSEEPYKRYDWYSDSYYNEILDHKDIDFERLNNGAPVLYNHDRYDKTNRIGIVEKAWVDGKKGRAILRFSKRDDVEGVWRDIEDGILVNVSVGYQIKEKTLLKENDDGVHDYRVSWTPHEISLVDIPADATVGVGRKQELAGDSQQPGEVANTTEEPKMGTEATETKAVDKKEIESAEQRGIELAQKQEKARRESIRSVFTGKFAESHSSLMADCLDDMSVSEDAARKLLLDALGKDVSPSGDTLRVEIGEDEHDKFRSQASDALAMRSGNMKRENNDYAGYTCYELARVSLEKSGISTKGMSKMDLVGKALTHSTGDFPYILQNSASKSMLKGWEEQPETFEQWTSRGELSDFKAVDRVGLNTAPDLLEVGELEEYKSGTMGERKETTQLLTYGRKFGISRQSIINDDLGAFTRVPQSYGKAARRKVGNLAYAVLTSNPLMNDGLALFVAGHNNVASAGVISITTLDAATTAMATQKAADDSDEVALNIRGSFLIVPVAIATAARTLIAAETDPSQSNSKKPNPFRDAFTVISDARLDANSASKWYMTADPNMYDTVEIAYLDGNDQPFLDQKDGWDVDGIEFKVRIDAAATALDHRTMFRNG